MTDDGSRDRRHLGGGRPARLLPDGNRGGQAARPLKVWPVVTLLVAGIGAAATWQIAGYVHRINSTRAWGGLLVAGLTAQTKPADVDPQTGRSTRTGLPFLRFPPTPNSNPDKAESATAPSTPEIAAPVSMHDLQRSTAAVEVIVRIWQWMMYSSIGLTTLLAVVALRTGWVRGTHLAIGLIILATTIGTLVGMRLLMRPSLGGLYGLSWVTHLFVAVVQGGYGALLLFVMRKKPTLQPAGDHEPAVKTP